MRAVVWHGTEDVRVDRVPDPVIQEPTDAIVRITSTAICGSDLHLYRVLTMYMEEGDILGHEPMGVVEEVGRDVTQIKPGDRVVMPFNIACGHCSMCSHGLQSQCETTQVHEHGKGAALFGYTKLYGAVPGGQAEYLRVPQAQYGPIKVPEGPPASAFSTSPTCSPRPGRPWHTPTCRKAARSRSTDWVRSARCAFVSPSTSASSASSASISCQRKRRGAPVRRRNRGVDGRCPRYRGATRAHERSRGRLGHRRGRNRSTRCAGPGSCKRSRAGRRPRSRRPSWKGSAATAPPRSTLPSPPCVAVEPSRSSASTAVRHADADDGPVRQADPVSDGAGEREILDRRHPPPRHRRRRPARHGRTSRHTGSRSTRRPTRTSSSRKKRTARSRSCWRPNFRSDGLRTGRRPSQCGPEAPSEGCTPPR